MAYLQPAIRRKNLHVQTGAFVTRILFNKWQRATGVEYRWLDGRVRTVSARNEVVVCAGVVRSPQLLMLSGIGPADHLADMGVALRVDLAGVGRNLQDMPAMTAGPLFAVPAGQRGNLHTMVGDMTAYNQEVRSGPLAANNLWRTIALIDAEDPVNGTLPNIQMRFSAVLAGAQGDSKDPRCLQGAEGMQMVDYDHIKVVPMMMHPKSRGRLLLNSKDPRDPPRIYENFFEAEEDVQILVDALRFAVKLNDTATFQRLGLRLDTTALEGCSDLQWGSDPYWRCVVPRAATTTYHVVGTCGMGPASQADAVVDSELRVHKVRRLRVVDASVMPMVTRASTYATTLMIAEKGAEMLKKTWLDRPFAIPSKLQEES